MATSVGRTKAEEAYSMLRKKVCSGELSPGERLTEQKVAEMLDVGRATAREAMLRLESEGFLKGRGAYGGKYVRFFEDQDPEEILQQYELREFIEGLAARLAAKNMTGYQIDELKRLGDDIATAWHAGDRDLRLDAAGKFHRYIIMNCGNPLLISVWESYYLTPLTPRLAASEEELWGRMNEAVPRETEHVPIVESISSHDPDAAEAATRSHVRRMTEAIRRYINEKNRETAL